MATKFTRLFELYTQSSINKYVHVLVKFRKKNNNCATASLLVVVDASAVFRTNSPNFLVRRK